MKKAAVVIGVNKTGKLTPLSSAAIGAQRVAMWLKGEGFHVECITDEKASVDCSQIEKAVESFVTLPPRYHLLLVYFSGHGYWQARSDVWLLSKAPVKPNEAINLETAMALAKYSGIPNVVFVSDACRSIPNSRDGAKVEGRGLFPNYEEINTISKIDYFKATSEALPAYEGLIDGKAQSVLTTALMAAYEDPDPDMVRNIVDGTQTIEVVPNRCLEDYLQRKIDDILAVIDTNLAQRIEANVPSSDEIYLARVRRRRQTAGMEPPAAGGPPPREPASASKPILDPGREAASAIERTLSARHFGAAARDYSLIASDPVTEQIVQSRLPNTEVDHFETQAGFVIHGTSVRLAIATKARGNSKAELRQPGDGQSKPGIVRLLAAEGGPLMESLSIVLQVSDGRCVILAGLPGYIGHATFNGAGMSNVSYVPSSNHWRWAEYNQRRREIDRLRALVAIAVDHNTFRLRSKRDAEALADLIRMYKGVDPTLGLYAAHAFSQAGNDDKVVSVIGYMREDLNADLYDVRLLARRKPIVPDPNIPVVPFCPMLTQSWHLLRARRVDLPLVLDKARAYLCGALWTTFESTAGDRVIEAATVGELR